MTNWRNSRPTVDRAIVHVDGRVHTNGLENAGGEESLEHVHGSGKRARKEDQLRCEVIPMTKTSAMRSQNLDHFLESMSRVLGIPRKRLDKILFQGQERPARRQAHATGRRNGTSPSRLAIR